MEITALQAARLDLAQVLNYDTAALKEAKEFTGDDVFKTRLLIQQYQRVYTESEIVARTIKAVQNAVEVLAVIGTEGEE
ncbi:DUF2560 family protein [Escherichia coli]